jgi:AcrR family transcriptional regulator
MSSEERKCRILSAVRHIFAHKGFEGTTTRDLAKEAGVSEALLYKHYPSKEALYQAMLASCDGEFMGEIKKITSLEASTSTLVTLVHFLASAMFNHKVPDMENRLRLYLHSLAGDGEFARMVVKKKQESCSVIPKIAECVEAAFKSGDLEGSPVPANLRAYFTDRLVWGLVSDLLPTKPAVDHGVPTEKMIEYVVWFSLRGIGMKDEAIQRYYNPKALALLAA